MKEQIHIEKESSVREKMIKMLEQLEFCVYDGPNYDRYSCPICCMTESNRHSEECTLFELLNELRQDS